MKKAVATICCGEFFERLAAFTHPTIKAYANRIGADFIVWRDFSGHSTPHYQKLELGKLLEEYDRVLYLDTDVMVRDDTPDLFQMVPDDVLGVVDESVFCDRALAVVEFAVGVQHDPRAWDGRFYNMGVMVLSQQHRPLFANPHAEWDHFHEETLLNFMIAQVKPQILPLPYQFNRMPVMDDNVGEDRCDSFIVHYAGLPRDDALLRTVAEDQARWQRAQPRYVFSKRLALTVEGGLAEHVAAEPALRYARERAHANDELVLIAKFDQCFAHLGIPTYPTADHVPGLSRYRRRSNTADSAETPPLDDDRLHPVTRASLRLMGLELPIESRQPRLSVDPAARASAGALAAPRRLAEMVLVHAGSGADDSSHEAAFWQTLVGALVEGGCPVALVGSRSHGEQHACEIAQPRALDLVDRLSVDELVAAISEARALVTADACMAQVAGAFDHAIALAAGARNSEYLLPWRRGSLFHRARVFGRDEVRPLTQFVREALQSP